MKKIMKTKMKLLVIFITLLALTSCASIEAVTLADGSVYTDFDAYVAYDVYNEFYDNGLIENKPILIVKRR